MRSISRISPIRGILIFLFLLYGALFCYMHQLTNAHLDAQAKEQPKPPGMVEKLPANRIVKVPAFAPVDEEETSVKNETSPPIPTNWKHGLVEGKVSDYLESGKDLWDYTMLPKWMKDYFTWHRQQRESLVANPNTWKTIKYYVVECSEHFHQCGGTADRLGPLPFHLRLAQQTNRLLLIRWERPAPLETFLLPPQGGINWRVPGWLWSELRNDTSYQLGAWENQVLESSRNKRIRVVRVKYQSHNHGQDWFEKQRIDDKDPPYGQVFHDLWRIFFTPTPVIASRIEMQMENLGLTPGDYIAVHLRALYGVAEREQTFIDWWTKNIVRCATTRFPLHAPGVPDKAMPILIVSDSSEATVLASQYAHKMGIDIVHRPHYGERPLHLEKEWNTTTNMEDFFDTFVDVYMIGMGRCTAYNMGGYGRWGSMMGYNSSCFLRMPRDMRPCDFSSKGRKRDITKEVVKPKLDKPLFLPPMKMAEAEND